MHLPSCISLEANVYILWTIALVPSGAWEVVAEVESLVLRVWYVFEGSSVHPVDTRLGTDSLGISVHLCLI